MAQKSLLVSGASGNLGKATVTYFLKQHWQVAGMVHHQSPDKPDNRDYREITADLLAEDDAAAGVAKTLTDFRQIDAAVLTAGGFAMGNLANTTKADLEKMYALNFETAYNLTRPLFEQMKKQGRGKLFFIGSEPGMDTRKGKSTVAYSLSKSLLFQLANIINAETEKTGVKAMVVVPATIDTPQNRQAVPDADFSQWQKPNAIAKIIHRYIESDSKSSRIIVGEEL